jgi:quercetin dioxygenase-like cupin family protein|tara:strand:+ start:6058 stop:6396 length:339 start_codon:yes stop_codon:yes gene_type:complete
LNTKTQYHHFGQPKNMAIFDPEKMAKKTLFKSERLLVGLNCFEPGQQHDLHSHKGMDKVYQVIAGLGLFLLEDKEIPMETGCILVAPENVPHGILNNSEHRLIVLAILTPSP